VAVPCLGGRPPIMLRCSPPLAGRRPASWTDPRTWTPAGTSPDRSHAPSPTPARCAPPGRKNPRSCGRPRAGRWPRPRAPELAEARTHLSNTPSKVIRSAVPPGLLAVARLSTGRDVFLWTKFVDYRPVIMGQVFLPHSRWITFPLLNEPCQWLVPSFPQGYPQGAHNLAGVSAHVIHTAVHRLGWCRPPMAGRMSEPSARTVVGGRRGAFMPGLPGRGGGGG
jgi:hypothetical protein